MHIKAEKRLTALSVVINLCYQEDLFGSLCSVTENSLINENLQTSPTANGAVQIAKMTAKLSKLKYLYLMEKSRSFFSHYSPNTVPWRVGTGKQQHGNGANQRAGSVII